MNAANLKHLDRSKPLTPLKAWRLRQMVEDPETKCLRSMRITDVERLHGIKAGTWHAWEQWPDHDAYRPPNAENLERLFAITRGEIAPNDFFPIEEWSAALPSAGGG